MKVKAGVLNFVLVVIMVISIISVLIFIYFRYAAIEINTLSNANRTIHNSFSGIEYGLSLYDLNHRYQEKVAPFEQQLDSIEIINRYWGGYNILSAYSSIGSSFSEKHVLTGHDGGDFHTVGLYLNDTDIPLSISGDTRLKGKSFVPEEGIKTAYFNRRGYTNKELVYGLKEQTEKALHDLLNIERINFWYALLDTIRTPTVHKIENQFNSAIVLNYAPSPITISDTLKGYQIIKSDDEIKIKSQAYLENVILNAPKITLEKGFRGNLQAYATDTIIIEDQVVLNYPSLLCINSLNVESYLEINEAKVIGEVIHFISSEEIFESVQLNNYIKKSASLTGSCLFDGYTLFSGEIMGNLMVNRFVKVDSMRNSTYVNFLVDIEIEPRKDSGIFVNSYFFKFQEQPMANRKIKWLK